eukprot:748650-Hanusia_phi.AAC.1
MHVERHLGLSTATPHLTVLNGFRTGRVPDPTTLNGRPGTSTLPLAIVPHLPGQPMPVGPHPVRNTSQHSA